jgi:hypothetical protein
LSQGIGAPIQKLNWTTVAQVLDRTAISPLSRACCHTFQPGLPVFRPGADSLFNSRPVPFLIGCELQCALDDGNTRIRQGVQVGCGYALG